MIRVLLVDDHHSFRQPLAFMLGREPDLEVVGQAGSLAEARMLPTSVDLAIVDLNLPDGDGTSLIKDLRLANPTATILVLTASAGRRVIARAVAAGAAGVLHKSVHIADIIAAVRRLHAGDLLLAPAEVAELVLEGRSEDAQDLAARAAIAQLTPREREVLQALATGMNNDEIGEQLHIGVETVRRHLANVFSKLDVDSRLQALAFAVRFGLVTYD